jgi:hypothetical protein
MSKWLRQIFAYSYNIFININYIPLFDTTEEGRAKKAIEKSH